MVDHPVSELKNSVDAWHTLAPSRNRVSKLEISNQAQPIANPASAMSPRTDGFLAEALLLDR